MILQRHCIFSQVWREIKGFSSGSICLVASHEYNELDYIRDYNKFLEYKK
jgi:hypothetical protein